jgi:hypothetical protein
LLGKIPGRIGKNPEHRRRTVRRNYSLSSFFFEVEALGPGIPNYF